MAQKLKEAEPSDYPNELRVINYNPQAEDLLEALGLLDEERMDKQMQEAMKIWNNSETLADVFVKISRLAENANELAVIFCNLGKMSERSRQTRRGDSEPKSKS